MECVLATGTRSRHNDPYVLEKLATIGLDRDSREVPWCPTQGALISVSRVCAGEARPGALIRAP